jgi:hypothetical protein
MQSVSMSANLVRAVGNSFVLAEILAQPASLAGSAEKKTLRSPDLHWPRHRRPSELCRNKHRAALVCSRCALTLCSSLCFSQ